MIPWWYSYNFTGQMIGVVGKGRAGKDTVGDLVKQLYARTDTMAWATPIKDACREIYGFSEVQLYGDAKDEPDPRYLRPGFGLDTSFETHPERFLTPRHAMQQLGGEWGRGCCDYTWLKYLARKAHERLSAPRISQAPNGSSIMESTRLVVVTDCRYVNEAEAVSLMGGVVWRVRRPDVGLSGDAAAHSSETEQDSAEMAALIDVEIHNDGSLEALRELVAAALAARTPEPQ